MQTAQKDTDGILEHHPSCKLRCVAGCGASPKHVPRDRGAPKTRVLHTGPVPQAERPTPPLWERIDDWEAVCRSGCSIPLPETYTAHERADERYSLDRWTRPDGIEDRALDDLHARLAEERKTHAKSARDVAEVAAMLREVFPAVERRRAVLPKRQRPSRLPSGGRSQDLLALILGEDPGSGDAPLAPPFPLSHPSLASSHPRVAAVASDWDVVLGQGGIYVGLVWGLALLLFGRERDTVSEHALGRMLPGEPVRDVRPPFAGAAHALAVAAHPLPGLGGGSCPWPQEDPRPARRTWSKAGEMKVTASHVGTESIRGEAAVNRVLDARAAERRAALTDHERAAIEVLGDRTLTRDEKALRLREIEALRRGIDPATLATAETERLWRQWFAISPDGNACPEDAARADALRSLEGSIAAREAIDTTARPGLLRAATSDVSDAELFRGARAAAARLQAAVERESRAGDALAPKRVEKLKRERVEPVPARGRFASEMFAQ